MNRLHGVAPWTWGALTPPDELVGPPAGKGTSRWPVAELTLGGAGLQEERRQPQSHD